MSGYIYPHMLSALPKRAGRVWQQSPSGDIYTLKIFYTDVYIASHMAAYYHYIIIIIISDQLTMPQRMIMKMIMIMMMMMMSCCWFHLCLYLHPSYCITLYTKYLTNNYYIHRLCCQLSGQADPHTQPVLPD